MFYFMVYFIVGLRGIQHTANYTFCNYYFYGTIVVLVFNNVVPILLSWKVLHIHSFRIISYS